MEKLKFKDVTRIIVWLNLNGNSPKWFWLLIFVWQHLGYFTPKARISQKFPYTSDFPDETHNSQISILKSQFRHPALHCRYCTTHCRHPALTGSNLCSVVKKLNMYGWHKKRGTKSQVLLLIYFIYQSTSERICAFALWEYFLFGVVGWNRKGFS